MFHKAILPGYKHVGQAYLAYLNSGKRTMDIVRQIVTHFFSGFDGVNRFLEFACGYGRFTRFLVQEMSREKIWTSDILSDAVAWQRQYLATNCIASTADPKDFQCQEKFNVIFAGSLFSHLPDSLFTAWLWTLCQLLTEDGVLVFSVHGESLSRPGIPQEGTGIQFVRESESDVLPRDIYGMSYVSEDYVRGAIYETTRGTYSCIRVEKGLYENQELYIAFPRLVTGLSERALRITPLGGTDSCVHSDPDTIVVRGWVIDLNRGDQIDQADLLVNDQVRNSTIPVANRGDVEFYFPGAPNVPVGWSFRLPVRDVSAQDLVICRLRNRGNDELNVYAPTAAALV